MRQTPSIVFNVSSSCVKLQVLCLISFASSVNSLSVGDPIDLHYRVQQAGVSTLHPLNSGYTSCRLDVASIGLVDLFRCPVPPIPA